jgi:hypothetical protein
MVGGTQVHREVIQREISRVLVLNLLWQTTRSKNRCGEVLLDKAFALIEGHPPTYVLKRPRAASGNAFASVSYFQVEPIGFFKDSYGA